MALSPHRYVPARIALWFTIALMTILPAADRHAGAAGDDVRAPLYPAASESDHAGAAQDKGETFTYEVLVRRLMKAWDMSADDEALGRLRRPIDVVPSNNAARRGEGALVAWIVRKAREVEATFEVVEPDVEAADDGDQMDEAEAHGAPAAEDLVVAREEAVRMLRSLGRWQQIEPRFGLRRWSPRDMDADSAIARGGGRAVVLVHGLDDPGWMWDDLAPELEAAGFVVLEFLYPNDGPIAESADLLALSLARLKSAADIHLDIVAHSMGGLVVRDLLTRPLLEGARGDILPHVDRFIMCGTPNHGSALAPMRVVTDLRERSVRVARGQDPGIGSLKEGRGLAAVDLTPGSDFLQGLNGRALPQDIAVTIIAGRLVADPDAAIRDATDRARDALSDGGAPAWTVILVRRFGTAARRAASHTLAAVGDGLVSMESARLEGVTDFCVIEANHASMLISRFGGPVPPPAIPIILDRLSGE